MITQQINISFTSAMAETIRIHTGESGRQIIFTPDFLEDIPNDHGADVIIVKPDNTFVIAAASIGDDGKIYVTIPEQAGAVSGVGNYILKVYDNDNLCIYSACGGFYIDDHLLTDEMLESIAEVYGYQFPQDFARIDDDSTGTSTTWSSEKIAEAIAGATPDIIDDENILYDKTWSSEKISYEMGNIQPFHVYSTTEQPVGRWIDGKTVYEKTFYITSIPTTTTANFDIGVPNLSRMISLDGFIMGQYNCFPVNCWQNYTYNNTYAYFVNDLKKIVFYVGNVPGGTAHFVVRYTKNE